MENRRLLSGTTYLVDSMGDSGSGSGTAGDLLYCVNQANANPGSTIDFETTAFGTITLSRPLVLTANTTILGPGSANVTLSGGGKSSILDVGTGVTASLSVLTLSDGSASNGGAISDQGNLMVSGSTFSDNVANTGTGVGGAIYADSQFMHGRIEYGAILTLIGDQFSNNQAADGGALDNLGGSITVTNTTFTNDSATNAGGAIDNQAQGSLTMSGGSISGCWTTVYGARYQGSQNRGGALENLGTASLTGVTISNDTSLTGGGIANESGATLTLTGDTLSCNGSGNPSSSNGGGLDNAGTATLVNDTIANNHATIDGGGIDNLSTGNLTLVNDTIVGNSATTSDGGGLDNFGSVAVNNTIIASDLGGDFVTTGGSVSKSNDLIGDGNVPSGLANTLTGDPDLEPLGSYGGPTPTMPPTLGSPVINAGSNALAVAGGLTVTTDEEGNSRIDNGTVDLGSVEADAPVITIEQGGTQTAFVGGGYASNPVVLVTLNGVPDPNVTVYFNAPINGGPGGAFSSGLAQEVVTTNSSGLADPGVFTANGIAGSFQLSASLVSGTAPAASAGLLTVDYSFDNLVDPTSLVAVGGSGLRNDNATLTATLMSQGVPVAGQPVLFSLGGNAVGTALTNASGVATLAGSALNALVTGGYSGTVTASFAGSSTDAPSTASGPANIQGYSSASQIATASGSWQSATIGTAFGSPMTVIVTDAYGNPVPGASAAFNALPGSGSFAGGWESVVVSTNASGVATAPSFTASTTPGTDFVQAVLLNSPLNPPPSTSFTLTATPTALLRIVVNGGSANRSYINTLAIDFNGPVGLQNVLNSLITPFPLISLTFLGLNGTGSTPVQLLPSELTLAGNVITINFGAAGITGNPTSTAGDGYYQVSVDPNHSGSYTTMTFDRLLGDVLGKGTVTSYDVSDVQVAEFLDSNSFEYDVDGNGVVNSTDLALVKAAQGDHLSGTLHLND